MQPARAMTGSLWAAMVDSDLRRHLCDGGRVYAIYDIDTRDIKAQLLEDLRVPEDAIEQPLPTSWAPHIRRWARGVGTKLDIRVMREGIILYILMSSGC